MPHNEPISPEEQALFDDLFAPKTGIALQLCESHLATFISSELAVAAQAVKEEYPGSELSKTLTEMGLHVLEGRVQPIDAFREIRKILEPDMETVRMFYNDIREGIVEALQGCKHVQNQTGSGN